MATRNFDSKKAGSQEQNEPRLLGSIVEEMLHGNSPLAKGYRQYIASLEFIETVPMTAGKRNPHVYVGEYITVTRRDDGSLRPNFKPMPKLGANLSVDNYAFEVYRELRGALKGLVEE